MIGRRTPWTPDHEWEKSKYKKLAVRNDRNNSHVAPCIRNDVLYNEDVLLARPERVIITEGVTDCISLMEHGFPVVSPVTVQIREADWERLLPKLAGVKTVFICQDNEVSEAGMQGALKTARILAGHGIATRVAVLPLGEKQRAAREKLAGCQAEAPKPKRCWPTRRSMLTSSSPPARRRPTSKPSSRPRRRRSNWRSRSSVPTFRMLISAGYSSRSCRRLAGSPPLNRIGTSG